MIRTSTTETNFFAKNFRNYVTLRTVKAIRKIIEKKTIFFGLEKARFWINSGLAETVCRLRNFITTSNKILFAEVSFSKHNLFTAGTILLCCKTGKAKNHRVLRQWPRGRQKVFFCQNVCGDSLWRRTYKRD